MKRILHSPTADFLHEQDFRRKILDGKNQFKKGQIPNNSNVIVAFYQKLKIKTRNALSWEQTTHFQQLNVQRNSVYAYFCSGDLDLE